jgi:phage repressor protein C with HTH and peptisase S24 domain/predicted DNA-binding transcriptional regulator AlpA
MCEQIFHKVHRIVKWVSHIDVKALYISTKCGINTPMKATDFSESELRMQEYVEHAISRLGGVREVAVAAGVSRRTVYAWKNGERFPSRSNLNRLSGVLMRCAPSESPVPEFPAADGRESAAGLGVHENDGTEYGRRAAFGATGAAAHAAHPLHDFSDMPDLRGVLDEFVFVSKADARPSAGGGSLQTGAENVERHAFRLDWLLSKTHDTSSLRLMEVMGRSMEPTLHNGDDVLVNEGDTYLVEDKVYVVRVQDEIYIKRFARTPGRLLFRGDNRDLAYQDIEIDPQDVSCDWTVIGRVIWAGKEL